MCSVILGIMYGLISGLMWLGYNLIFVLCIVFNNLDTKKINSDNSNVCETRLIYRSEQKWNVFCVRYKSLLSFLYHIISHELLTT